MQTSAVGNRHKPRTGGSGFTILELLVVITIIAMASASVVLVLRDSNPSSLPSEAERLIAQLEAARAKSRTTGVALRWQTTPEGFTFDDPAATPIKWLSESTTASNSTSLTLGPEPMIGPQRVHLSAGKESLVISTDGIRPFTVQAPPPPAQADARPSGS
jgi:general secretion pathway protein H